MEFSPHYAVGTAPPEFQAAAAAEDAELSSTEGLPEPEEQPTEEAPLIGGQVWRGTASPGDAADSAELSSTDDDSDQEGLPTAGADGSVPSGIQ